MDQEIGGKISAAMLQSGLDALKKSGRLDGDARDTDYGVVRDMYLAMEKSRAGVSASAVPTPTGKSKKNAWPLAVIIGASVVGCMMVIRSPSTTETTPSAPRDSQAVSAAAVPADTPPGYYRNYKNELVKLPTNEELGAGQGETTPNVEATSWTYDRSRDEMRDGETVTACTISVDQVHLDFPYKNQNTRLCIRKSPKWGLDAYVRLTEGGQYNCNSYDGCTVHVRFDAKSASAFTGGTASDGSNDILFFRNASRFVENAKTSKRLIVEAEFYQAGVQQMTFNSAGLEWPPK